jgi:hypothetical protein
LFVSFAVSVPTLIPHSDRRGKGRDTFSLITARFKTRTLPIAVYGFLSYEEINWGGLTAARRSSRCPC